MDLPAFFRACSVFARSLKNEAASSVIASPRTRCRWSWDAFSTARLEDVLQAEIDANSDEHHAGQPPGPPSNRLSIANRLETPPACSEGEGNATTEQRYHPVESRDDERLTGARREGHEAPRTARRDRAERECEQRSDAGAPHRPHRFGRSAAATRMPFEGKRILISSSRNMPATMSSGPRAMLPYRCRSARRLKESAPRLSASPGQHR